MMQGGSALRSRATICGVRLHISREESREAVFQGGWQHVLALHVPHSRDAESIRPRDLRITLPTCRLLGIGMNPDDYRLMPLRCVQ